MTQTTTQYASISEDFREELGILNKMHDHGHPVSESEQMVTEYMEVNNPGCAYLIPQLIQLSKYGKKVL